MFQKRFFSRSSSGALNQPEGFPGYNVNRDAKGKEAECGS
jgi:hypothetical protein